MRYANSEQSLIVIDGHRFVPVEPGNVDYDAIVASGIGVAPYIEPLPTAVEIKAEARARIVARYPSWRQLNIIREGGAPLADMATFIDAVRSASDALETTLPADFTADVHWPAAD